MKYPKWGRYPDKFPFGVPRDEDDDDQRSRRETFSEGDDCPECGEELVERTNRSTGEEFIACSGYRDGCEFTSPID